MGMFHICTFQNFDFNIGVALNMMFIFVKIVAGCFGCQVLSASFDSIEDDLDLPIPHSISFALRSFIFIH